MPDEYWTLLDAGDLPEAPDPSLSGDEWLNQDEYVTSPNGIFTLYYQADGNLVVSYYATPIWSSLTDGTSPGAAYMQADGNFVVYDANDTPLWDTGTAGNPGAYVSVTDSGDLAVFRSDGLMLWWAGCSIEHWQDGHALPSLASGDHAHNVDWNVFGRVKPGGRRRLGAD